MPSRSSEMEIFSLTLPLLRTVYPSKRIRMSLPMSCRNSLPYAKYKNKNFEIVGVSLDQSADAWKEAIKKLNITWPQMPT